MKIQCTQAEKEWLLDALMTTEAQCLFVDGDYSKCQLSCEDCMEEKIEWEIKGG